MAIVFLLSLGLFFSMRSMFIITVLLGLIAIALLPVTRRSFRSKSFPDHDTLVYLLAFFAIYLGLAGTVYSTIKSSEKVDSKQTDDITTLDDTNQSDKSNLKDVYDYSLYSKEIGKKGGSLNPPIKPKYRWLNAKIIIPSVREVSEDKLKATLTSALSSLQKSDQPDAINIWVYQSPEHVLSNISIASLDWWPKKHSLDPTNSKNIEDKSSYITKLDFTLPENVNPDKLLTRIPEKTRQAIWNAVIKAEDRAEKEAEAKYPLKASQMSIEKIQKYDFDKASDLHYDMSDRLTKKYREIVFAEYKITKDEMSKITEEGLRKKWPMPSLR